MKSITIKDPYLVPPLINGVEVVFPYTIINKTDNLRKDEVSNKEIKIGISTFLLITWGYNPLEKKTDNQLIIRLAFPFAINLIQEKYQDGTLRDYEEVILTTENSKEYPFDLDKIDKISGYCFNVEGIRQDITQTINTNFLADEIITLRDNINALIMFKFEKRLLMLSQERYILDFFRPVIKEEEFTHRISSLANLISDFNKEFLNKITENKDDSKQPIDLCELFLNQNCPDSEIINEIIDKLRKIRKIRQGYPIHTDTAKGLISALGKLGIDYPILSYEYTWKTILETYRDVLKKLLTIVKRINAT